MQLNVYVPKGRAQLLAALDAAVRRTGRQKNELVLEALERYFSVEDAADVPRLRTFDLGAIDSPPRAELYDEMLDRRWPPR
jgi:hypothetical protein